jgi:uncharacterized membrane protein YeaQ/YmgE (transglycosylase-associated protein family)
MAKQPVIINGQTLGRFGASWLLFKESFRFLRADKEMVWIPLITTVLNLLLFGLLVSAFVFLVYGGSLDAIDAENEDSPIWYVFAFLCYVIGAFTLALSQAGITHIVYTRIRGGDATLGEGLKTAFSHWFSLLLWSIITSTVGMVLRMIAERSKMLGAIVAMILGVAWSVLTYFVVPAMVIDKHSAFGSISKSSAVFRKTWGETLVSNISIGLVFFIAHIVALFAMIGLVIATVTTESVLLGLFIPVVIVAYMLWVVIAVLVQSSLEGVLKTLLYVYASENIVPENFNRELLEKMLSRKDGEQVNTNTNEPPQYQGTGTNQM